MSKAINEKATTRLSSTKPRKEIGLQAKRTAYKPISFRLTNDSLQNLREITKQVNELSNGKISDTKVLQALIQLGSGINKKELFEVIKSLM